MIGDLGLAAVLAIANVGAVQCGENWEVGSTAPIYTSREHRHKSSVFYMHIGMTGTLLIGRWAMWFYKSRLSMACVGWSQLRCAICA